MTKNPSPREPALGPASDLGLWLGGYRPEESTDNTDGTAILVPRRRPVQHRSRERFARILAAAREVLLESGVESFTFDAVARRADVPIGTLYQFFANKYALICELDRADSSAVTEEMRGFLEETPSAQWPRVVEELIDRMARLWRTDPSRRAVWHAVQSTPAPRTTTMANQMPVVALVAHAVAPLSPGASDTERGRLAGFLIHAGISMLNLAVQNLPRDEDKFDNTVEETKRMLISYLFLVAQDG